MAFDAFDISAIGDKKLSIRFQRMEKKLQRRILLKSIRKSARVIRKAARTFAPVKTRNLRRNIKTKTIKSKDKSMVGIVVRTGTRAEMGIPQKAKGYYPAVQEYGSATVPAHPYMRPAAAQNKERFVNGVGTELRANLNKL